MEKVPMTTQGHVALTEELERRQSEDRPRIVDAIAEARALDIPVLFVGAFPFSGEASVRRVATLLRMRGDGTFLRSQLISLFHWFSGTSV